VIAESITAATDALEAQGLRVAVRSGDLTPPCCYVQLGGVTDDGGPLAGGLVSTLWVFWLPVRGVENLPADAAALDSLYAALTPLTMATLTVTRTSLTVSNDTWPGYRADVSLLAVPDLVEVP
jgi:hypothetical protein